MNHSHYAKQTETNSYFDRATLATDVIGLIHGLNQGKPFFLVGQDWVAAISYGVLGAFPDKVSRSMIMDSDFLKGSCMGAGRQLTGLFYCGFEINVSRRQSKFCILNRVSANCYELSSTVNKLSSTSGKMAHLCSMRLRPFW